MKKEKFEADMVELEDRARALRKDMSGYAMLRELADIVTQLIQTVRQEGEDKC